MIKNFSKIGVIILAAGESVRLGQPKQLLRIGTESVIQRSARQAISADCGQVVVMLGANFDTIQAELIDLPVTIVNNENWSSGMGVSIKFGLRKMLELQPNLEGVIISLCDQVFATSAHFQKIIKKQEETNAPIVASFYESTFGVPVLFGASMFEKLLNLPDNRGAKAIIHRQATQVAKVPLSGGEYDIDTPEDWQNIQRILNC